MDRFFDDSFERLLREKTDELHMYPSRRVWSSLYNNLHPGSHWPSRAVSIGLLSLLLVIGHLNSNQPSKKSNRSTEFSTTPAQNSRLAVNTHNVSASATDQQRGEATAISIDLPISSAISPTSKPLTGVSPEPSSQRTNATGLEVSKVSSASGSLNQGNASTAKSNPKSVQRAGRASRQNNQTGLSNSAVLVAGLNEANRNTSNEMEADGARNVMESNVVDSDNISKSIDRSEPANPFASERAIFSISALPSSNRTKNPAEITSSDRGNQLRYRRPGHWPSESELSYMEQHQLAQTRRRGFTQKLSWTAWGSPSLVYRNLTYSPLPPATQFSAALSPEPLNPEIERSVKQHASWGFEAGVGLKLELIRRVRVTAGVQANYTRYNLEAFENAHPVATTLTMNNRSTGTHYEVLRATKYSNGFGMEAVTLHNQTLQVSLPLGVEYRVAGRHRLQWYVGTTIQPTFLVNGKAYLISTDRRNYVEESGMLRRWNLNAGLETYISYTGKNGIIWNVGPQYRRQLFSTNRSQYAVEELLNGYGVKIGITKPIR